MIVELYRLLLGMLLTRGRLAAVGSVAAVLVLLGAAAGTRDAFDRGDIAFQLVSNLGLAVLVPVTTLVFASATFGDLVDDTTLVYVWLAPVARWKLVVASLAATLTVTVPLAVVPVTLTALLARVPAELVVASFTSGAVAAVAYAAVFVGVGLVLRRALAWGLAYVLIWEAVVAGIGTGPARASVRHYSRSILTALAGRDPGALDVGIATGLVVPLVAAAAAVALTSWRLARQDVA